jgi:hypothetical protein
MTNKKRFLPLSWKGFAFEPFQVPGQGVSLSSLDLPHDTELITFTRGESARALIVREYEFSY